MVIVVLVFDWYNTHCSKNEVLHLGFLHFLGNGRLYYNVYFPVKWTKQFQTVLFSTLSPTPQKCSKLAETVRTDEIESVFWLEIG